MNKFRTALLACLLFMVNSNAQTPMFFKTGTGTTGNTIPMNQASQKTQLLYTPTDFSTTPSSGNISKIYFRNSAAGAVATYTDFEVNFKQNTDPSFPSTSYYTGFTPALAATTFNVTGNAAAGGWFEIQLPPPYFVYNNAQTLIVEIRYSAKTGGLSSTTSTSTGNKRCSGTSQTATTGTTNTTWNDFGMDITPTGPCTSPPTAGTATASTTTSVCAGANVLLNVTGNSGGTGQMYQWQSSTTATGTYTNMGTASPSTNLSIAPTTTLWYRVAVTCGAQTSNSAPVQVIVNPPLPAGTYTINSGAATGGTNYQTFNAAINALACGIAGNVVFNVVAGSGPYNEQVIIPEMSTSPTKTITINGNGAGLTYGATVSAERATLKLDGADYITVNNLKIIATGGTYGIGVQMLNDANNNTINACNIFTDTTATGTGFAGISISGSATSATTAGSDCDSISITNNTINGGYYSMTLLGDGTTSRITGNKITGNSFTNFYYYGIYLNGNDGVLVENNDISRATRSNLSVLEGIYLTTGCIGSKISKNRIHNTSGGELTNTSAQYCIYLAADGTTAKPNIISNNLVYDVNGAGIAYGIYKTGADTAKIWHNTLSMDYIAPTPVTTAVYGLYQTAVHYGMDFSDNIITVGRNSTGVRYCVYVTTATATFTGNNNNYFTSGTSGTTGIGYYSGAARATLASWQSATGQDAAATSIDPVYQSAATGNFKPTATTLDNMGIPVGITTDVLNIARSLLIPDMGAYEFGFPPCPPPTNLAAGSITATSAALSWTAASGVSGYEYVLDQVAANPSVAGTAIAASPYNPTGLLSFTTYYFHLRSSCGGGSFSSWVTISFTTLCAPPVATITAGGPTTFCANGNVVLNANTATGLSYQWKIGGTNIGGATTASYTATASGSYTVVTTIGTCNTTSAATVVTVNPRPDTTVTVTPASGNICTGATATLNAVAATGATYQWFKNGTAISGATASSYVANTAGDYKVAIMNASSCADTSSLHTITVLAAPTATVTPSGAAAFCQGGNLLLSGPAPVAGITYQWQLNSAAITGATADTYTATAAGNYRLVLSNGTCADTSAAVVVTVNALPVIAISPATATAICEGNSVTLNASGGATYVWSPATGLNVTTGAAVIASPLNTITYTVTGTAANGCTNTGTKLVTVNPKPVITFTPVNAGICRGSSVSITASGANTYAWSPATGLSATTGATVSANPLTTTTYTITGTSIDGCIGTATKQVVVTPLPIVTVSPSTATTICAGASVALTASGATTYTWAPGAGLNNTTGTTVIASPATTTTYTVTGTTNGCVGTATKLITVNPLPTAIITASGTTSFCQGGSVVLNANTGTGLSYIWRRNGTPIGVTTASYTATTDGNYDVIISNGTCTATSNLLAVVVSVPPVPVINISGPSSFCQGGSTLLSVGANPAYTYQWLLNGVNIAGANNDSYNATVAGNYSVTVTNSTCVSTSTAVAITVRAAPAALILPTGATIFCQGDSVLLSASIAPGYTHQWKVNGIDIPGAMSPTYFASNSGDYSVMVSDANCSSLAPQLTVTVNPLPAVPVITVINGSRLSTSNYITYQWYNNGVLIPGATNQVYDALDPGNYTVVVTNFAGCKSISAIEVITSVGVPTIVGKQVRIYPNPANDKVFIAADQPVNVMIQSMDGKEVLRGKHQQEIDLRELANGVYMLRITTDDGALIKTERLVKEGK